MPDEVRKFLSEIGRKGGKAGGGKRWANHPKLSEEEKKAKKAEYMKEYRQRKNKEK